MMTKANSITHSGDLDEICIGDKVEAGSPNEDTGVVLDFDRADAFVEWSSGIKTWTPIVFLRRVEAAR